MGTERRERKRERETQRARKISRGQRRKHIRER